MYWNNEKGSALLVVFMVTIVTFILGSALLTIATMEKKISINQTDEMKALNIAEAGIDMAISQLKKDVLWRTGYSSTPMGEGQLDFVKVVFVNQVDAVVTMDLEAKGRVKDSEKILDVRVEIQLPPLLSFGDGVSVGSTTGEVLSITGSPTIRANLSYQGSIEFKGNMKLIGRLYTENNLINSGTIDATEAEVSVNGTIQNTDTIIGTVYAGGDIDTSKGVMVGDVWTAGTILGTNNITGTWTTNIQDFKPIQVPPIPVFSSSWFEKAADQVYNTSTTLVLNPSISLNNEIIFVHGNLNLSGSYQGRGTIVATGDITYDNNITRVNQSGDALAIISFGNMKTSGNNTVEALMICDQTFTVGGDTVIGGALIARYLVVNGGIAINYDAGLNSEPPPGIPTTIKVVSWQEKYN